MNVLILDIYSDAEGYLNNFSHRAFLEVGCNFHHARFWANYFAVIVKYEITFLANSDMFQLSALN